MSAERYNLTGLVLSDLWCHAKLALLLLLLVVTSAIGVVWTAHNTRLLSITREQLLHEQQTLEVEWRHLILEEKVLSDPERIERLAVQKLGLHPLHSVQDITTKHKS